MTALAMELALVGAGKRVLEVGCAVGSMSAALNEQGCTVVAVEIDPVAAQLAEAHCERVVVANVENLDFEETFGPDRFDIVLFGDVLEHLRDPLATLRRARHVLAPGGGVVASIPNVAHGAVRLALLAGRWDYAPLGLLDETHLRFFTRSTVEQLFRDAGLMLVDLRRVVVGLTGALIPLAPEDLEPALVDRLNADVEALTFQFVIRAVPDDGNRWVQELFDREQAQADELIALRTRLAEVELEATRLQRRWERLQRRPVIRLYQTAKRLLAR